MAYGEVGGGELGYGRVHLLQVVEGLRVHPLLHRGLGHELVHRPLVHTGKAPAKMYDDANVKLGSICSSENWTILISSMKLKLSNFHYRQMRHLQKCLKIQVL